MAAQISVRRTVCESKHQAQMWHLFAAMRMHACMHSRGACSVVTDQQQPCRAEQGMTGCPSQGPLVRALVLLVEDVKGPLFSKEVVQHEGGRVDIIPLSCKAGLMHRARIRATQGAPANHPHTIARHPHSALALRSPSVPTTHSAHNHSGPYHNGC
jgi:hypothetical protein